MYINRNINLKQYYHDNKLLRRIVPICIAVILVLLNFVQPFIVTAAEDTNNKGEVHAFYPSNAVFSEQIQNYIDDVDSLSFAWSRIYADDPGSLNTVKGKNGNMGFYYPQDYLQSVKYAEENGKSIQLSIYMSGSDSIKLIPYEDKQSAMIQAIVDHMQKDITQGEGIYFDGVVIDFEGLRDTDGNNTSIRYEGKQISVYFTEFLTELKAQLAPIGKKLYVAVNPKLFFDGYNYAEILDIADRVILMAHDYEPTEKLRKDQVHQYTGYDALEPVNSPAPIQLVREALNDMQSAATDDSELSKVWLQITFDSSQWQYDVNGAAGWESLAGSSLSREGRLTPLYKSIKARIDNTDGYGQNISYGYNNELQSPYIQYHNSKDKSWNVILYEDSKSISAKIDLAMDYGLGGISIWSLGNIPDYNDSKGKEFHLDGWATIVSKMNSPYSESVDSKKQMSFTDKVVERAIREKLGKLSGNITVADLKDIYRLKLPEGVKSLTDMKNLVNLEYLDAQQLNLKDITALGDLINLRVLYLQRNQITDISSMKKLINLEILSFNGNQITSIKPITTLTSLRELYLSENKVTDITSLVKLSKLKILNLSSNNIMKIESLTRLKNLEVLYLQRNSISDIKAVSGLTNLRELSLNGNQLSNINALSSLVKLQNLFLKENKIINITSLGKLKNLRVLSLDKNQISDLKPLAGLTKLTELYLPENKVTDINPLKSLKNLKILSLNRNSVVNLTSLAKLTLLEKLYMKDNKIKSIAPLKGMINLQELYLSGNKISDYNPVKELYSQPKFKYDFD